MSEIKPRPYGTVVIDTDGEVIMLLGLVKDTDEQTDVQLVPPPRDPTTFAIRCIWDSLINEETSEGFRYKVQE